MSSFPSRKHFDRGRVNTKNRQAANNELRGRKRNQAADIHRPKLSDLRSSSPDENQSISPNESRTPRPPPIGVTNLKFLDVIRLIKNQEHAWESVPTFSVREVNLQAVTRIHTHDDKTYDQVIRILNGVQPPVQYFSYQRYTQKKTKIVMYGLPHISIEKIQSAFEAKFHIQPVDIKYLKSNKIQHLHGPRIYMLVFRKVDSVRAKDLREAVPDLFDIQVRFEYFTPRKFHITQCSNCQQFGHGEDNCHRNSKCVRCGGQHHSKNCPLLQPQPDFPNAKKKIPEEKVKCGNCNGPHTANYLECPSRVRYLQDVGKINESRQKPPKPFKFSQSGFPPLNPKQNAWFNPQPGASESQNSSEQQFTLQLVQQ